MCILGEQVSRAFISLISSIVIALWILANEVTSSTLRDRQLGMQVTEICRDLSASRPSFSLDFENSGGYSLWLAVNLVTLEHGAGESLEGFVLRKLEGGLKEKERRCLNAKEVSLPPSHPRFYAPSLTRSTRSFLPISNKTYLEQRLMRISSAAR